MEENMVRFSALIDRIYQGALHPEVWPAVLEEIAAWVGVSKGTLYTGALAVQDGGFSFDHNLTSESAELYNLKYQKEDLWVQRAIEKNLIFQGNVLLDSDLLPEGELFTSAFYRDFLALNDMARLMSGIVFDQESKDMPCVVCAMYRGRGEAAFTEADRFRFRLILPHLSRALGVMFRLREADFKVAASLAALDRLASGILLLNAKGRVAFANQAARRILEDEDGLSLRKRPGSSALRLYARDTDTQAEIDAAIRSVTSLSLEEISHFSRQIAIRRPSGRLSLGVQFSALDANNEFGTASDAVVAIAFLSDAALPVLANLDTLIRRLGLTASEARLAAILVEGIGLTEAADRLGVSLNTAKAHLRQIYQKTGTDSRAKLVKLLVSL